ncbi:MAG: alpha/beta hydrolase [Bacteroidetes bacterium]|nr:alpha/beta hydrolase [Bacteroidota bacterium]MDA0903308.1 alpha/beta hydrolase [Bacteroidota bacterium]MDA1242274.1 alpha/beta hydrolase [Bacteroidota bacterium]
MDRPPLEDIDNPSAHPAWNTWNVQTQHTSWTHQGWTWQGIWATWGESPNSKEGETWDHVVVAFHGFGRPIEEMLTYAPLFPGKTAMLSVALCHHQGSSPPPNQAVTTALEPALFQSAIDAWVLGWTGESTHIESRVLLGYSLGGRVAMTLFEHHRTAWDRIVLLAPDGFYKNPVYRLAVETPGGRAVWRWCDQHIDFVRSVVRMLRKCRFIPAHLEHFALHHTENQTMRDLVARTWMTHRMFWPTLEGMTCAWQTRGEKDSSQQGGSTTHAGRSPLFVAFFGERDRIIRWSWCKRWRQVAPSWVWFLTVPSGHVMRHQKTVECLRSAILQELTPQTDP